MYGKNICDNNMLKGYCLITESTFNLLRKIHIESIEYTCAGVISDLYTYGDMSHIDFYLKNSIDCNKFISIYFYGIEKNIRKYGIDFFKLLYDNNILLLFFKNGDYIRHIYEIIKFSIFKIYD